MTLNAGLQDPHYWAIARKDRNLAGSWDPKSTVRGGGIRPPGMQGGARVITLQPDEAIFRWASTKVHDPTASPWWSTKRGAQGVLRDTLASAEAHQTLDTSGPARTYSGVARTWSDLGTVVVLRVVMPVRCFIGLGKPVEDDLLLGDTAITSTYAEKLQLYVPGVVEPGSRPACRSAASQSYFRFEGRHSSTDFSTWQWSRATGRRFDGA